MTAGESGLELGVIGNCQIAALIDHAGRLIWSCLPRLDGDPFFCALLTREHAAPTEGVFAIEVRGLARTEQAYVRNSAILETTLHDAQGGAVRIVDFCPRFRWRGRMFRPTMIVRLVEPL
ncbi:MAG TPA: trehalase-like domain-containing protein, partial [Steroidobacteraceae bacterium]|nr:trehalase-like domain-containing protein [Steroidobacteraceae bacterium]